MNNAPTSRVHPIDPRSLMLAFVLPGCAHSVSVSPSMPCDTSPAIVQARRSTTPVKIDGRLDDPIWQKCDRYEMTLADSPPINNGTPEDAGYVQFAWDADYFYFACNFVDRDLAVGQRTDGPHYYRFGDVAELFLLSASGTMLWEMYVTPIGDQTTFFFPGRGRIGLPEHYESPHTLNVGATTEGTLNDWQDRDNGWTAEMAVPISELNKQGISLAPGTRWRILVGRYNYSRYLIFSNGPELSSFPRLPSADFHDVPHFADLELID